MVDELREDKRATICKKISDCYFKITAGGNVKFLEDFKKANYIPRIMEEEPYKSNPDYLYIDAMYFVIRELGYIKEVKVDENNKIIDFVLR